MRHRASKINKAVLVFNYFSTAHQLSSVLLLAKNESFRFIFIEVQASFFIVSAHYVETFVKLTVKPGEVSRTRSKWTIKMTGVAESPYLKPFFRLSQSPSSLPPPSTASAESLAADIMASCRLLVIFS